VEGRKEAEEETELDEAGSEILENLGRVEGEEYEIRERSGEAEKSICHYLCAEKGEKSIRKTFSLGMFFSRLLNHNARLL